MRYYDPNRHRWLDESAVLTLPAIDQLVPVRGAESGDEWFAYIPWTGESRRLSDLSDDARASVLSETVRADLIETLLTRCADVRALEQVPPMIESDAQAVLDASVMAFAGPSFDAQVAVTKARARGFTGSEVAFALSTLDDSGALSDALDGIEVISVGQVLDTMRAHTG